ncbi:hypothetical protein LCGC14_2512720, partial [marine sediment metagenome]
KYERTQRGSMNNVGPPQDCAAIEVETPDGKLFAIIIEEKGVPHEVLIEIGKTGQSVRAWADAIGRVISLCLQSGLGIERIIEELSGVTTDKLTKSRGQNIRSGPEGVAYALIRYIQEQSASLMEETKDVDYRDLRADE